MLGREVSLYGRNVNPTFYQNESVGHFRTIPLVSQAPLILGQCICRKLPCDLLERLLHPGMNPLRHNQVDHLTSTRVRVRCAYSGIPANRAPSQKRDRSSGRRSTVSIGILERRTFGSIFNARNITERASSSLPASADATA